MRWLIGVVLLVFSLSSSADDVTGGVYVATNNEDENSLEIAFQPDDYSEFSLDMDLSADGSINHDTGELEVVGIWPGGPQVHSCGLVTIPHHQ